MCSSDLISSRKHLLPAFALAVLTAQAWADQPAELRRIDIAAPRRIVIRQEAQEEPMEPVTYLGV